MKYEGNNIYYDIEIYYEDGHLFHETGLYKDGQVYRNGLSELFGLDESVYINEKIETKDGLFLLTESDYDYNLETYRSCVYYRDNSGNIKVLLDSDHQYRSDYSYSVDSYSELDEIAYFNMKSSLDNVRSTFIFPPTIIPGVDFVDVDAFYHDVTPKKNSKLPWLKRDKTVKGAPRKMNDSAYVKRKVPEQFYKRYR